MTTDTDGRVLVAIDNSAAAAPVLAAAGAVAPLFDATIDAIHVHEAGKSTASAVANSACRSR